MKYQPDTTIEKTSKATLNINYSDHTIKAASDEQTAITRQTIQSETTTQTLINRALRSYRIPTQHPTKRPEQTLQQPKVP